MASDSGIYRSFEGFVSGAGVDGAVDGSGRPVVSRRAVLRILAALSTSAVGIASFGRPAQAADLQFTIDPTKRQDPWEGWGTSLAWWGKMFGDRDDLADIFFTLKTVTYQGQDLPGLGLNIVRYNAGASSSRPANDAMMKRSPNVSDERLVDGYWIDWNSPDPASTSWDWSVDANQRAMLLKAKERGADKLELFSNSPMWWMCKNHNPSGADDGLENLLENNRQQHAVYLATIAKFAKDNWGVEFTSVEPCNEPNGKSWVANGIQEGCVFYDATLMAVVGFLRAELDNRGLTSTIVSAADWSYYSAAIDHWAALDDTARGNIGQVNVHGYQKEGNVIEDRSTLAAAVAGKKLWNSEYGDGDGSGAAMAWNILADFEALRPAAWAYWQVVDGGVHDGDGWGLINWSKEGGIPETGSVNSKYHVLAQFTRHIRPGMKIIDARNGFFVAAHDPAAKKLVVVAYNQTDDRQWINFNLSKFATIPAPGTVVDRWHTVPGDSGDKYVQYKDTKIEGTEFWSWFEPQSVQTFEVPDVA